MTEALIDDADIDEFLEDYNQRLPDSSLALSFDNARREILKSWEDVQACPGSGKTTLVAAKLLILEKKLQFSDSGICVLTHTNVARDEIISRIECHPAGFRLIQYPNFIGTIQEFVNRFLAAPYLRSIDMNPVRVDDDACAGLMSSLVSVGARNYLEKKGASLFGLKVHHENGELLVPGFDGESSSPTYRNLVDVFCQRINRGYFFYSEMYFFARQCIQENSEVVESLRKRFSCVLLDEMQDTQKFQDELINSVFRCDEVSIQRLGDPDQAIFDSIGGESPNETFNGNTSLVPLNSTHRLPLSIATKIRGLSLTGIGQLQSLSAVLDDKPHTVFLYTDATKTDVLERYCELLDSIDPVRAMSKVKAVGATEGEGGHISAYWPQYDRTRSVRVPRPRLLIEAVSRQWWRTEQESAAQYGLLVQCVLDLLRKSEVFDDSSDQNRFHSATSLVGFLKNSAKYDDFRNLLTFWVLSGAPNEEDWGAQCEALKSLFDIPANDAGARGYLAFSGGNAGVVTPAVAPASNMYRSASGREVEVATIHSVKGETHDATLVFETKNHHYDLEALSGRLSLLDSGKITGIRKQRSARLVYVAVSRPRRLLCMAAHQDRVSEETRAALEQNGWQIQMV